MSDYLKFKKLLAWFVNQLNINNGIIDGDKLTGLGYNANSSLRKHYADCRTFTDFELDCTINHQYGNYATTSNYISLTGTDFNTIPEFDKDNKAVISLYIGNHPPKKPINRKSESVPIAILGLNDDEPNQALRNFFDMFQQQILEYKSNLATNVADYSSETLGHELKTMYDNAEKGKQVINIHLFGIEYGHIITSKNIKVSEIVSKAGLNLSYATEVSKGINIGSELHKRNENSSSEIELFPENTGDFGLDFEQANTDVQAKKQSKAAFLQWFKPIITALKDLGGSATPKAVREKIIENMGLTDDEINQTRGKSNVNKLSNEIAFARNYLAYEGFIDKKTRGIWALTEKGKNIVMTPELASNIFMKWVDILKERRENSLEGALSVAENDYEQTLLENMENIDEYSRDAFLTEVFFDSDQYDDIVALLKRKKNIILQGAPGVGKSFMAKRLAYSIIEAKDENKMEMIQFHQSYSYEDFIEGFRPNIDKDGKFDLIDGIFKKFCKKATYDLDNDYFFIIDEINRGNLSKVMGELMLLLENDKRGEEFAMKLTYSGERFYVPENVYVIGMMNTADRSLAMIDYALRRRFSFIPIEPIFDNEQFKTDFRNNYPAADAVIEKMQKLNELITNELDSGHQIGHSYFCSDKSFDDKEIEGIFKYEIEELLREYFFDDESNLKKAMEIL